MFQKNGPANTLIYLIRDVVPRMPRNYRYTLLDIGNVINQLMGSGYTSNYSLRKFRIKYELYQASIRALRSSPHYNNYNSALPKSSLKKSLTTTTLKVPSFLLNRNSTPASPHGTIHRQNRAASLSPNMNGGGYNGPNGPNEQFLFDKPFTELIIWSVLTKRQEMAKLMWEHGK